MLWFQLCSSPAPALGTMLSRRPKSYMEMLPPEVWRNILWQVVLSSLSLGSPGHRVANHWRWYNASLTTCKYWMVIISPRASITNSNPSDYQTLALPIMYETIHIGYTTVVPLARMLQATDPDRIPTRFTKMVDISSISRTRDDLHSWNALNVVMGAVSGIRYFGIGTALPFSTSVLSTLAMNSRDSLRELRLRCEDLSVLQPINFFRALHTLVLTQSNITSRNAQIYDKTKPLTVPTLLSFEYDSDTNVSDHSLRFIANSRFHPSCELNLCFLHITVAQSTFLAPLFENHRPVRVYFYGRLGLVPSLFECTDELHLVSPPVPPRGVFRDTERLPTDIFLTISSDNGGSESTIWSVFEALEERAALVPPRAVRIHIDLEDIRFTWIPRADLDADEALFFTRALRHAMALTPRGILLLDEDGKDMSTLFSAISV
jgi:hypothetical protein